ncbi:MAG: DedA family protein [Gemmatimonadota bacterium]
MPGWLAYLTIFIATVLENVFPPTPSDVIVALGGFLSHHSVTNPYLVFLSAWSGGVLAAGGVYAVSRRHGRQFFAGTLGRKLLPARAVAVMEREYQRLGPTGLFLARLIPGVRTFVAPFAGLADLSPAQVMVPIALASAAWYAGLTWAGMALGAEWDAIITFIGRLNVGMAIFGVVVIAAVVLWRLLGRHKNQQRALLTALELALSNSADASAAMVRSRTAELWCEIAGADPELGPVELADIETVFRKYCVKEAVHPRPRVALPPAESIQDVAAIVADRYPLESRQAALARLGSMLSGQTELNAHRARLTERATEILVRSAQ